MPISPFVLLLFILLLFLSLFIADESEPNHLNLQRDYKWHQINCLRMMA